jgi:hypothetical protein
VQLRQTCCWTGRLVAAGGRHTATQQQSATAALIAQMRIAAAAVNVARLATHCCRQRQRLCNASLGKAVLYLCGEDVCPATVVLSHETSCPVILRPASEMKYYSGWVSRPAEQLLQNLWGQCSSSSRGAAAMHCAPIAQQLNRNRSALQNLGMRLAAYGSARTTIRARGARGATPATC